MTAKNSIQSAPVSAVAVRCIGKRFFGNRDAEETRRSEAWREDVAEILQANLTNLDALAYGFVPSHVRRMTGF